MAERECINCGSIRLVEADGLCENCANPAVKPLADDAVDRLAAWSAELATPRLNEKYGYVAVRDAEVMGVAIAAAIATMKANPDDTREALGMKRTTHNHLWSIPFEEGK